MRPAHLLCLSAKSEEALKQLAARYLRHLRDHPDLSIADVCYTATVGRSHFKHRLAIVGGSASDLQQCLEAVAAGREASGAVRGEAGGRKRPGVAFLFPAQAPPHGPSGRQLFETEPTFRRALEQCAEILRRWMDTPLLEGLFEDVSTAGSPNHEPALFSLEYGLYELWSSWGVSADAVMGHGVGEYVAACVAGVFSLEDGLKLAASRGRLMRGASPQDLPPAESTLGELAAIAAGIASRPPRIPLASSFTGEIVQDEAVRPGYWVEALRQPARLGHATEALRRRGCEVFLEIGPGPFPISPGGDGLAERALVCLPSLSPALADSPSLLASLGELYVRGVRVDWSGFERYSVHRKVALPTYPFQRESYWLAAG